MNPEFEMIPIMQGFRGSENSWTYFNGRPGSEYLNPAEVVGDPIYFPWTIEIVGASKTTASRAFDEIESSDPSSDFAPLGIVDPKLIYFGWIDVIQAVEILAAVREGRSIGPSLLELIDEMGRFLDGSPTRQRSGWQLAFPQLDKNNAIRIASRVANLRYINYVVRDPSKFFLISGDRDTVVQFLRAFDGEVSESIDLGLLDEIALFADVASTLRRVQSS